jgi:hypothetical protein
MDGPQPNQENPLAEMLNSRGVEGSEAPKQLPGRALFLGREHPSIATVREGEFLAAVALEERALRSSPVFLAAEKD